MDWVLGIVCRGGSSWVTYRSIRLHIEEVGSGNLTLSLERRCAHRSVRKRTRRGSAGGSGRVVAIRPVATLRRLWRVSRCPMMDIRDMYQRGQVKERCNSHGSIQAGWNLWPQGSGRNSIPFPKSSVQIEQLCRLSVCPWERFPPGLGVSVLVPRYFFTGIKFSASGVRHRFRSGESGIARCEKNCRAHLAPIMMGANAIRTDTRMASMMATLGGLRR